MSCLILTFGFCMLSNAVMRTKIYQASDTIFTRLDYGTYVDLMNTSKRPELGFTEVPDGIQEDRVVPFDDRRSIRRIVLRPEILLPTSQLPLDLKSNA